MYDRVIKKQLKPDYFKWLEENYYPIYSPRHRGIYAEIIFRKFCNEEQINVIKINQFIDILEQIPANLLKKNQQKELENLRVDLDFFCIEKNNKNYFVEVKMGTSNLGQKQKKAVERLKKNEVFLFRVFEDGEVFIKRIN
jgi:hypothetical protein